MPTLGRHIEWQVPGAGRLEGVKTVASQESASDGMVVPVGRKAALVAGTGLVALGFGLRPVSATQATPAAEGDEAACATAQANKALGPQWIALWNGDLAVADAIAAPDFVAHDAPSGGNPAEVRGPEGLRAWVERFLSGFTDARVTTEVGPMADGDLLAGRFLFSRLLSRWYPGRLARGGRQTCRVRGYRHPPRGGRQTRRALAERGRAGPAAADRGDAVLVGRCSWMGRG